MNKRLNNKGFTLVELLAVLVLLIAIIRIAFPIVSSSLERQKQKQNKARYQLIESAAELYVTDNKNVIYKKLESTNTSSCAILISDLIEYLSEVEMKDAEDKDLSKYYVIFTKPNNYEYSTTNNNLANCK